MEKNLIYKYLNDDELLRISIKISEMEKLTAGEIRVSIKEKKSILKRNKPIVELAKEEFYRLKMDETRDKTGILIFLILGDREFDILADSGINEKVSADTWDKIRDEMQIKFRRGEFSQGILLAVEKVGHILANHFPVKPDDVNELSNKVVF